MFSSNAPVVVGVSGEDSSSLQKDNLQRLYHIGAIMFGMLFLLLIGMPDRTQAVRLATKLGGASGFGLAGVVSHILAGATQRDRLSSDTFKRLNLGLLSFSGIGLFAAPAEAAFRPKFAVCLALMLVMTVAKCYGCTVAFRGWKRGVEENRNLSDSLPLSLWKDFVKGSKITLSGLFETTKKARAYRKYVLLVGLGALSAGMQGYFNMGYSAPLFHVTLQWSAVARLCLLATMIYSLKDAAERDRLTKSHFILINFAVGVWSLLVGQGQSAAGFSISRTPMLLFSVPFLLESGKYQMKNLQREKSN